MTRPRNRTGTRRAPVLGAAAVIAAVAVVAVLAATTSPAVYLSAMAAGLLVQTALIFTALRRRAAHYDIRGLPRLLAPRRSVEGTWGPLARQRRIDGLQAIAERAEQGFTTDTLPALAHTAADAKSAPSVRAFAAESLRRVTTTDVAAAEPERHFDVILVSNLNLPGGTTSSNTNEIRMLVEGGKRVGLVHHPLYAMNAARPINPKVAELIDGETVRLIGPKARVSCELLLMRFPPFAMQLRDDLPYIRAEHRMLVVNQAPMTYYDPIAGRKRSWEVGTVHRNLTEWIGPHRWTAAGPLVRQVLLDHHADEMDGVDLAEDFWYPTLDLTSVAKRGAEPPGRPLRIGRHSRDHLSKWPELATDLRRCYPEGPEFAVRVLGGTKAVERLLGRLPSNWESLPFDSMPTGEFLTGLDCYVYYPSSTLLEAFGRGPVEAMAAGVPTLLPPVFRPVFGNGALYAEPAEVHDVLTTLAQDPQQFAMQQKLGLEAVEERFSFGAHRSRLRALGINV